MNIQAGKCYKDKYDHKGVVFVNHLEEGGVEFYFLEKPNIIHYETLAWCVDYWVEV